MPSPSPIPAATRQLILVPHRRVGRHPWDASAIPAECRRCPWTPVAQPGSIVVGKTGLAWGRGLEGPAPDSGPVKHEGDGKSPAGVFTLSQMFGYAPPDSMTSLKMPYVQATENLRCVDDSASPAYNTLIHAPANGPEPWSSAEHMRLPGGDYEIGVFVDHNAGAQRKPGGGSCIFLHVWEGPDAPTVGCTAMPLERIRQIAEWLDPREEPVLVQLPEAEYQRLKSAWGLP